MIKILNLKLEILLEYQNIKEEIAGTFYENEMQKTNEEEFRTEKVIKRKGNKLC